MANEQQKIRKISRIQLAQDEIARKTIENDLNSVRAAYEMGLFSEGYQVPTGRSNFPQVDPTWERAGKDHIFSGGNLRI